MERPTSLTGFRYAASVALTLSAIFAVVATAISIPSDNARAQVPDADDVVAERAEAWWDALTPEQRTNAFLGKEYDHDTDATDDDPAGESEGRQLPPEASGEYDALVATGTAASGTPPTGGTIGKNNVTALVDGVSDPSDIYAVGEQVVTDGQDIRGFQSVELWWDHLTCAEARIAVGEDNNDLQTTDQDTTEQGFQAEASVVCDFTLNTTGDAVASTSVKAYSDVKAMADAVGQAILGLDTAGSPSSASHARAKAWWDTLTGIERVSALYGPVVAGTPLAPTGADAGGTTVTANQAQIASQAYDDITTSLTFTVPVGGTLTALPLNDDSKALVSEVKELINDRWQYVYHMGGRNTMNLDEFVHWWDSIDSTQKRIAVGNDNEPQPQDGFTVNGFSVDWNRLNPSPGTVVGKARELNAFTHGRAILGLQLPDAEAWWDILTDDGKIHVVYGNPPRRDDRSGNLIELLPEDRDFFLRPYDQLFGYYVESSSVLPPQTSALLVRHGLQTVEIAGDGGTLSFYSAKDIVDAIANEIFDPPNPIEDPYGGRLADGSGTAITVTDDNEFDWPYRDSVGEAAVGDWWQRLDCRTKLMAIGSDNDYLLPGDSTADPPIEPETHPICAEYPGAVVDKNMWLDGPDSVGTGETGEWQRLVDSVGSTLFGRQRVYPSRPTFNEEPEGIPTISGLAQVGTTLTADVSGVTDADGIPPGNERYTWWRLLPDDREASDYQFVGTALQQGREPSYVLQPDDTGHIIVVEFWYDDGERYREYLIFSNATSTIAGSPGEISRIEPSIRGVTVSSGDTVRLSVEIYGLQNSKDNSIGGTFTWTQNGDDIDGAGNGREITYTAPGSPGTYTVKAELDGGSCQPDDEEMRDAACSAEITVQVRRPSAPVEPDPEPVNPPGDIPTILTDSDGNQYEVFTPVDGGTFDSGEGYRIHVPSGAVPNGEFIGIRMSDDGEASNIGMTHQRYTLGGNMYGIHAVDASGAAVSSYELDDPATVCLPLPAALRSSIADLAVVSINSDGSLTVHSASVRIGEAGTQVCGNVSGIPTSVAVGSQGAPDAIPTPELVEEALPETGGASPSSNAAQWLFIIGVAILTLSTLAVIYRRRSTTKIK